MLSQYDYSAEFRKTQQHGNADALSRLLTGSDLQFDREEMGEDVDNVHTIHMVSRQMVQDDPRLLIKETSKIQSSLIMRFLKEGWPNQCSDVLQSYKKTEASLPNENGCLFYKLRVVIPASLLEKVLQLLHLGHFGMQRMKQLARSAVNWPQIDQHIERISQKGMACAEFQNQSAKPSIHSWTVANPGGSWESADPPFRLGDHIILFTNGRGTSYNADAKLLL